jgi:hypothetical protein
VPRKCWARVALYIMKRRLTTQPVRTMTQPGAPAAKSCVATICEEPAKTSQERAKDCPGVEARRQPRRRRTPCRRASRQATAACRRVRRRRNAALLSVAVLLSAGVTDFVDLRSGYIIIASPATTTAQMNKAFVKEESSRGGGRPRPPRRCRTGAKNYMTRRGYGAAQGGTGAAGEEPSGRRWCRSCPGRRRTATAPRMATTSTARSACARSTGASASS